MENDRQVSRRLLQVAGIEIDVSDNRTAIEIARAFGLIGIDSINEHQPQLEVTQPPIPVIDRDRPYLAF